MCPIQGVAIYVHCNTEESTFQIVWQSLLCFQVLGLSVGAMSCGGEIVLLQDSNRALIFASKQSLSYLDGRYRLPLPLKALLCDTSKDAKYMYILVPIRWQNPQICLLG
jgi:hypothetical protein